MRRILRLRLQFHRSVKRLAPAGSPHAQALAATLARLAMGDLPGPFDAETIVPPVRRYWYRRVPQCNPWVYYEFDESTVAVVTLTQPPPVPI